MTKCVKNLNYQSSVKSHEEQLYFSGVSLSYTIKSIDDVRRVKSAYLRAAENASIKEVIV